jgi:hypothetical protein
LRTSPVEVFGIAVPLSRFGERRRVLCVAGVVVPAAILVPILLWDDRKEERSKNQR